MSHDTTGNGSDEATCNKTATHSCIGGCHMLGELGGRL